MNSLSTASSNPNPRRAALTLVVALAAIAGSSFGQPKPATPSPAPGAEQKYKTNVKGPADAPIKVVEFADFMCPGCQAASQALHAYFAQPASDINLTFKNFPLEQACNPGIGRTVHNGACELALGSICASEQGMFWAYHDRIFSKSWEQGATHQDVIDNGVASGMDKARLEACLASPEAKSKLAIQIKEGFETMVKVTPTIVVNGKTLSATNQFANAVEEERKRLAATPAK